MKKWLKQQLLEITAWTGFILIAFSLFAPRSLFLILGIVLIAIDDEKARKWINSKAPELSKKIDAWMES